MKKSIVHIIVIIVFILAYACPTPPKPPAPTPYVVPTVPLPSTTPQVTFTVTASPTPVITVKIEKTTIHSLIYKEGVITGALVNIGKDTDGIRDGLEGDIFNDQALTRYIGKLKIKHILTPALSEAVIVGDLSAIPNTETAVVQFRIPVQL